MDETLDNNSNPDETVNVPGSENITFNNAQNIVDKVDELFQTNFWIEWFSAFAKEHPFIGDLLTICNIGVSIGGGNLADILSATIKKPSTTPDTVDNGSDSPEDDELQKEINKIVENYSSKIENAIWNERTNLINKMFGEIFDILKKNKENDPTVFEKYVEQKINQKKAIAGNQDDLLDNEKTKCIKESFDELIEGVEEETYMKLTLEKIKYECKNPDKTDKEVTVEEVLQKIAEEFQDSKKYAVNSENINNIGDKSKLDIDKGTVFRNAMLKSWMIKMLFESIEVTDVTGDQIEKYCNAQRDFEKKLYDELIKEENQWEKQKACITKCYQKFKETVHKIDWFKDNEDVDKMMQDYMKNKWWVFAEIVNEDNAPSAETQE